MRSFGGGILLSATDLTKFIGCRHATALDLEYLRGGAIKPREDTDGYCGHSREALYFRIQNKYKNKTKKYLSNQNLIFCIPAKLANLSFT